VRACELLNNVPEGWVELYDGYDVIITQPVSRFDADPDIRVTSLIDWAQQAVGRAMECIPNF
jgi:hypothetical protein